MKLTFTSTSTVLDFSRAHLASGAFTRNQGSNRTGPPTCWWQRGWRAAAVACLVVVSGASPAAALDVGLAVRDVSPQEPIWLGGYAARKKPSERVDIPLLAHACALRGREATAVFVALDNCEVSHAFTAPVLQKISEQHRLKPGSVIVVCSHSHSAPVLQGALLSMYALGDADREAIRRYSENLQTTLSEVVSAALADLQPAALQFGLGRATFAMNRREFREGGVVLGENPDGPVDWDVPVLKIVGSNAAVRAILFGYACHATSIAGDDFYVASGDYIAYARQHLQTHFPGAMAIFLTGMGGDANPSPRGSLILSKRHGLELAGAVAGVLGRPMRPVQGDLHLAYLEAALPLQPAPSAEQLQKDAQHTDSHIRNRAQRYLEMHQRGTPPPTTVSLPQGVVRIGEDLTFFLMGGEVVVDYAKRLKRQFAGEHPWTVGYAYHVPCYIPSMRLLKEGGYEPESSLIYYGIYGPFQPAIETIILSNFTALATTSRPAKRLDHVSNTYQDSRSVRPASR